MDSMDKYYNMSMVDVAYELMSKKKSAVNFFKLWEEVCQMKKFIPAATRRARSSPVSPMPRPWRT